jgi:hypothetical protein
MLRWYNKPERWTQGAWARLSNGKSLPVSDMIDAYDAGEVACLCLSSCISVLGQKNTELRWEVRREIEKTIHSIPNYRWSCGSILVFNDNHSTKFEDVIDVLTQTRDKLLLNNT